MIHIALAGVHPAQSVALRHLVFLSELSTPTSVSAQVYVHALNFKNAVAHREGFFKRHHALYFKL
jgi:hypothetical protein